MYTLLPNILYSLNGSTTNAETNEITVWEDSIFHVRSRIGHPTELCINGYGYSLFRKTKFPFILIGNYSVKTGLGNLTKQHIVQTEADYSAETQCKSELQIDFVELGNYLNYNLCFYTNKTEEGHSNTGFLDASSRLTLHLASDAAFGIMTFQILSHTNSSVKQYISQEFNNINISQYEKELYGNDNCNKDVCLLISFYVHHSMYTNNIPISDRLYAEIIYPKDNRVFYYYYRAGFKLEGWKKDSSNNNNKLNNTSNNNNEKKEKELENLKVNNKTNKLLTIIKKILQL